MPRPASLRRLAASSLLVCLATASAGPQAPARGSPWLAIRSAAAQPKAPPKSLEEATDRYKRGVKLFEEQDYNAALLEFRRAYELAPNYRVAYNVGQVYYQLQNYAKGLQWFERYLNEGGKEITPERRAEVAKEIEELRARVARLEFVSSLPDVEVSIDDEPVGRTPFAEGVVVSAGRRKISASKAGKAPFTQVIEVAGRETKKVQLTLLDLSAAPTAAPTASVAPLPPPASAPTATPSRFTGLSWAGIGVAGALAVGATITGVLALGASSDFKASTYAAGHESSLDDQKSKVRTRAILTDVMGGAALVTLGVTLALTFSRSPEDSARQASSVRVGFAPRGAWLEGAF